ncbi:MAG: hypothetical protein LBH31_03465, partial [Burkholderiaceae bacterium]|nr:hypothetical protein [Burkholderiaceae bacterium]
MSTLPPTHAAPRWPALLTLTLAVTALHLWLFTLGETFISRPFAWRVRWIVSGEAASPIVP